MKPEHIMEILQAVSLLVQAAASVFAALLSSASTRRGVVQL